MRDFDRRIAFGMKQVQLTKGYVTLVDDQDFDFLSQFKWCAGIKHGSCYARRRQNGPQALYRSQQMHRLIMGVTDPKEKIDHRDGNTLNNQRSNLRICTHAQNLANRGVDKRSRSGYKGVSPLGKKWRAYIVLNYKQKVLGRFDCPIEAAKAYDRAAIEMHGEFCNLNFPQ